MDELTTQSIKSHASFRTQNNFVHNITSKTSQAWQLTLGILLGLFQAWKFESFNNKLSVIQRKLSERNFLDQNDWLNAQEREESRWKKTAELADTPIDESRRSSSMLIRRLQWLIVNDLLPESFSLEKQSEKQFIR